MWLPAMHDVALSFFAGLLHPEVSGSSEIAEKGAGQQASGEAPYTSDVGCDKGELYAYPVMSTQALATLVSVDASKVLEVRVICPSQVSSCKACARCESILTELYQFCAWVHVIRREWSAADKDCSSSYLLHGRGASSLLHLLSRPEADKTEVILCRSRAWSRSSRHRTCRARTG